MITWNKNRNMLSLRLTGAGHTALNKRGHLVHNLKIKKEKRFLFI